MGFVIDAPARELKPRSKMEGTTYDLGQGTWADDNVCRTYCGYSNSKEHGLSLEVCACVCVCPVNE